MVGIFQVGIFWVEISREEFSRGGAWWNFPGESFTTNFYLVFVLTLENAFP